MDPIELLQKIGRRIRWEILQPLRAPYMPPGYERRWGKTRDMILSPFFAPFRKYRDRLIFQRQVMQTDIFIVGHPKSGNTWLAYMLAIIICKDFNHHISLATIGKYVPVIHGRDSKIVQYPNLSQPRVFRSEWPIYPDLYPKVIYLLRDPRSVLLSYYHMYRTLRDDPQISAEAFVNEYLSNGYIRSWEPLVRWDKQVVEWTERAKKEERILIVKYEDMVDDRAGLLKKIVEFAEIPYSDEILTLAEERGSFGSMRDVENKHGAESYIQTIGKRGRFVRSGKIDEWRNSLDQRIVEQIENELGPVMRKTGYLS